MFAGGRRTASTAVTLALAGVATGTTLDGTALAEPKPATAQVKEKVNALYRQAETATEKYNGAKVKTDAAEKSLGELRDEAARRQDRLNEARVGLGAAAAAQYRAGGVDPALRLALSSGPDHFLDRAALTERADSRQAAVLSGVREQMRDLDQVRDEAGEDLAALKAGQGELREAKETVTGRLSQARKLLNRLDAADRARVTAPPAPAPPSAAARRDATAAHRDTPDAAPSASPARSAPAAGGPRATPAAPNSRAAAAVSYARGAIGSPYVWGAAGPNAFDCSGLTQAAYRAAGISLPRTTYSQINTGHRISRSELAPGDLVFFYSSISHVGIYVGGGRMIHAPSPGAPVRLAPVAEMPFAGAARVV
ncbi:C40 family peptidase [Streptomyces tsukubensis]|uniref:NlpC/P60 domain-containing protein n=1 Tax=Streptomyces tsukubensis TaxID=83656 RepID=A0A1V4A2Z5_9ACTN|nr:C40 family peptidase [Streptomyces tsukubensis]OON74243.1 hypothetical protein B1H18_25510 [Streptomyces tsukubensis]QFR97954.1 NlpC/P60 family protein [Streptomyces tsukubensis]